MQRICKYCGITYTGDPGSTACPDCAAKIRSTSLRDRVCIDCSAVFLGGPSAKYCPPCRRQRKLEADRRHKRNGTQRQLGSIDHCAVCNQPYNVAGSNQRYCPDCAAAAIRENDRRMSRLWASEHATPDTRRIERQVQTAEIKCVICGKYFRPDSAATTCSAACAKELKHRTNTAWEHTHRAERNTMRNRRRKDAEAAMSPEEYQAYRDKINARARENYRKRKEKKQ